MKSALIVHDVYKIVPPGTIYSPGRFWMDSFHFRENADRFVEESRNFPNLDRAVWEIETVETSNPDRPSYARMRLAESNQPKHK